jgi:hypothetical protein
MTKNFKIARKPGQVLQEVKPDAEADEDTIPQEKVKPERQVRTSRVSARPPVSPDNLTTRKTIEVPEDYFFKVKMRAFERRIREKDLWAEILEEYFRHHPIL